MEAASGIGQKTEAGAKVGFAIEERSKSLSTKYTKYTKFLATSDEISEITARLTSSDLALINRACFNFVYYVYFVVKTRFNHKGENRMEATTGIDSNTEVVAKRVLDAAFNVHSELGPGLLESVYETCLAWELEHQGIKVSRQVNVPILYRDRELDSGLRLDLLVGSRVIVEVKTTNGFSPIHKAQLLSYLKLANVRIGLLLNFNVISMKDGIKRVVN